MSIGEAGAICAARMMKPSLTTAALVVTQTGLVLGVGTPVELV